MKVVNLVTGDQGGGGRAAYRLNKGLQLIGCDATLYLASKFANDPTTLVFKPRNDPAAKLRRLMFRWHARIRDIGRRKSEELWVSDFECQRGDEPIAQLPKADIYNLHTVENFFNYSAFFPGVVRRTPAVWTLHSMGPFTGGCDYTYGCERFIDRCGKCPMLRSSRENDLSRRVWLAKEKMFGAVAASRLHLVAPSRWIDREAGRSSLLRQFPRHLIPYGVDIGAYAPRDKRVARETLEIPQEARVLMFVAHHSFDLKLKGFHLLIEALKEIRPSENLFLIALGGSDIPGVTVPYRHLGYVFNDNLLSLAYSAADIFVIPSIMDNLPNVVLESMACGTPVVGFETGGIPDMVQRGVTGELAPTGDVRAFREAIEALLANDGHRATLSRQCREVAVKEYSLEMQGSRYLALYESILMENAASG